jgi:MFS family permease
LLVVTGVLLTTLTPTSNPLLITLYLLLMGIALGMGMPVTTLAVQASVERKVLGVATSATQFIRTMGATVGTALIGTIVTGGYVARLMAGIPAGIPAEAIDAMHSPNALVDPKAVESITNLMAAVPNGAALTESLLTTARLGLAGAIQSGFYLMLGGSLVAFVLSFIMANTRLDGANAPARTAEQGNAPSGELAAEPVIGH